jgi:rhodanese-related sulfurtransferase
MEGDQRVPEVDVEELAALRGAGIGVVDVRNVDEWEDYRVPGAHLIPLPEVPHRLGELDKDEKVYVICKSGGRSARAVQFLREAGYDAVNVAGGTDAWREAGHPLDHGPA